jgi:hypothetical protein
MKYLVVKGWLGFGDRLESLKMCTKFAMENNLQIYVDWTDSMWNHDSESFYRYFSLINIPQLDSLDCIPSNAKCYPKLWNGRFKNPFSQEMWEKEGVMCDLGLLKKDLLNNDADVLVVSSIGKREIYHDSSFFADVFRVVDTRIISEVRNRQESNNLRKCMGIHIRGTDRITKRGRQTPIRWLALSAFNNGGFSGKPMIAVSDDQASFEMWKAFFPQTIMMSSLSLQESSSSGNHNASKQVLKNAKDVLNVDLLVDFFTLASCERIISTYKDSRFFHEAVRFSKFLDTILSS